MQAANERAKSCQKRIKQEILKPRNVKLFPPAEKAAGKTICEYRPRDAASGPVLRRKNEPMIITKRDSWRVENNRWMGDEKFREIVSFCFWLWYTVSATQFNTSRLRESLWQKVFFPLYLYLKRDEIVWQQ